MRREHRRQAGRRVSKTRAETPRDGGGLGKKKLQIKRNEIRARVTKIEVYPRGSECEDNRGPTRLDPPSFGEARDGPPRSAREFRQPSGARDDRSRVRGRVRFPCFHREPRTVPLKRGVQPGNLQGFAVRVSRGAARSRSTASSLFEMSSGNRDTCVATGKFRKTPRRSSIIVASRPTPRETLRTHAGNCSVVPSHRETARTTAILSALLPQDRSALLTALRKGRASFDTLASQRIPGERQIPQHLDVPLTHVAADDVYRGEVAKSFARARGQTLRKRDGPRVSRGMGDAERRASELRVRVALSRLSGSALGTESGEREAPSDFRGIHRHPYRRGGRYPCLPLSTTRVLAFPLPRRPHHLHRGAATRALLLISSTALPGSLGIP